MSDLNETHPYSVIEDISAHPKSPKVQGKVLAHYLDALKRAKIPDGGAELIQKDNDHLVIRFRNACEKDRFQLALSGKSVPDAPLPSGPRACADVKFNSEDYRIAHFESICTSIDPQPIIEHLIQVCKIIKCKDFRVMHENGYINVYLPTGMSGEIFTLANESLLAEKHAAGIEILKPRAKQPNTPVLRLLRQ